LHQIWMRKKAGIVGQTKTRDRHWTQHSTAEPPDSRRARLA